LLEVLPGVVGGGARAPRPAPGGAGPDHVCERLLLLPAPRRLQGPV